MNTAFVQSNANVGSGLNTTTWTITLPSVVDGNWLYLSAFGELSAIGPFSLTVSSSVGVQFPAVNIGPAPAGTNKFEVIWSALLTASGSTTVTISISGGIKFSAIAAALAEYTSDDITTAQGFVSFQGWSIETGDSGSGSPLLDYSDISGTNPLIESAENVGWSALSPFSNVGISQIEDTTLTPELQGIFVGGVTGASPPVWNSGGLTHDGSIIWQDVGTAATSGLMIMLSVGVLPFVEFPALAGIGGYTLRAQDSNADIGIQLWDKNTPWIDSENITLTKSVDTYYAALAIAPMSASAPAGVSVTVPITGVGAVASLGPAFVSGSISVALSSIHSAFQVQSIEVLGTVTLPIPAVPLNPDFLFFRPVRSRLAARFSGSYIVEISSSPELRSHSNPVPISPSANDPDSQPFVAAWNSVKIARDPTDIWITVTAGQEARLDILSQVTYGRSDLWWALAQANDIINPFERPRIGDKIRVPSLSRVIRIMGQVGV